MKKFFTRLYRKFQQKKVEATLPKTATINNDLGLSTYWGFVVPHTKKAIGAVLKDKEGKVIQTENAYGAEVCNAVSRQLGCPVGTRDAGGLDGAYGWLNIEGCKFSIEPHLNAFNTKAEGFEVLVIDGDLKSEFIARKVLTMFSKRYPNRVNRGIKKVRAGQNGFKNLEVARKNGMEVALLTEMFFIDNEKEYMGTAEMAGFFIDFINSFDV